MKAYTMDMGDADDPFCIENDIREHAGMLGAYTTRQAEGAIPNGTVIVKAVDEPGDKHHVGDEGVVLGSLGGVTAKTALGDVRCMYFVAWANEPDIAMGIIDVKIKVKP